MFGRRKGSTHQHQAPQAPPNASASLAATKAFVRSRDSNASLSSAAAAAALRTHTTSPAPVGGTITKRMARRGSASSHGSGSARGPGLRRHSSSGSMTERSFREQSPSRSSIVDYNPSYNAPPVPALPNQIPSAVHRRASSLEPPHRGASPTTRGGGRGVSLDRGAGAAPGRAPGHTPRVMSLSQVPEDELDVGPRSVNFSRPMSPPQSPEPQQPMVGHGGWFGGPVVNDNQTFRGESKPRPQSASGTTRARPRGSSISSRGSQAAHTTYAERPRVVDPKSPYAVYDPSTRTFIHKQDAMNLHRALSQDELNEHRIQQRASQQPPNPAPSRNVVQRAPAPPPQYVQIAQSPVQQERERPSTPPVQSPSKLERSEDASPTPQSKTRAHTGPVLTRQTSEDLADADIKHQVNANPSRKLDYHPLEPQKTTTEDLVLQNQDSPYPRVGTPVISTPAKEGIFRGDRNESLSPPRNAHFAATSVELSNGVKHQPPPRSVSPAKSALKPSPSVSRRSSSPLAYNGAYNGRIIPKGAPSEASDTMSEDGSKKKKKTVRVSFDEAPVIAGTSTYIEPETPSSPAGLSASRWSSATQEQDLDDVMKPRPALPSFGSIRERNRRSDEGEVPEKVTETVSSSMSTSVGSIGDVSSDHALGGVLAQDLANKQASQQAQHDPLPPQVTSVEGSGYLSDSDQSETYCNETPTHYTANVEPKSNSMPAIPEIEPKTLTTPSESKPPVLDMPLIAVQPASPMEGPEPNLQRSLVPGGWDDGEELEPEDKRDVPSQDGPLSALGALVSRDNEDESSDDNSSIYSDAYEDLSEDGGFASIDAVVDSPVLEPSSGLMLSKYADTSPVVTPKSTLRQEVTEDSNQKQDAVMDDWDAAVQHWSRLTDSQKQQIIKDEPAQRAVPQVPTAVPEVQAPTVVPKVQAPRPKVTKAPSRHAHIELEPKALQPARISQPAQPSAQPRKSALKKATMVPQAASSEPKMRKTMRGTSGSNFAPSPAPEPHMRQSMRANTGSGFASSSDTHMRKSMRSNEPLGNPRSTSGLAASRHSMPATDTKPPRGALQKKNLHVATSAPNSRTQNAPGPIAVTKPKAPAPVYDSDSDASASSFQRQRPQTSDSGRYSMRSSMRSGPAPTMRSSSTMRPISPPVVAPPSAAALRKSMRPSSPEPASSIKSSKFSLRSLSPAGRFRSSKITTDPVPPLPTQPISSKKTPVKAPAFAKPPKAKAPPASAPKTRFKSRFVDSDSDEDDRPRRFQSRFADSDDDEEYELPSGLAPVRGIPRKPGEEDGDSTDLEDEASDNERSPSKAAEKDLEKKAPSVTNGNSNGQGALLAAGSLRDSKHAPELPTFDPGRKNKAKRGFFGLGKKKTASSADAEPDLAPNGANDIPFPPAHRNRGSRPLTPIGEDKSIKSIEAAEPPSSRSPKLHRRSTPQWGRSASDSWPLPQPPRIGEEARPQSADGVKPLRLSLRPTMSKRNSSYVSTTRSMIDPKSGKEVTIGRTGKKKKFQGLRRVFGLND